MIFNKEDVTSETFFKYDLIAVPGPDAGTVEILKNRHTGEVGLCTIAFHDNIVAKYETKKDSNDEFAELLGNLPGDFKALFGEVVNVVEDAIDEFSVRAKEGVEIIKPQVEQFADDLMDTIQKVEVESELMKLEVLRETAIKEGVSTKGFLKKVDAKIGVLKAIVD